MFERPGVLPGVFGLAFFSGFEYVFKTETVYSFFLFL